MAIGYYKVIRNQKPRTVINCLNLEILLGELGELMVKSPQKRENEIVQYECNFKRLMSAGEKAVISFDVIRWPTSFRLFEDGTLYLC